MSSHEKGASFLVEVSSKRTICSPVKRDSFRIMCDTSHRVCHTNINSLSSMQNNTRQPMEGLELCQQTLVNTAGQTFQLPAEASEAKYDFI